MPPRPPTTGSARPGCTGWPRRDLFLNLKAHDRVATTHPLSPSPFVVYVDRVESTDGSVNLQLEASVRQTGITTAGNVRVQVDEQVPRVRTYNALHSSHFLPDGTALPLDPAVYVNPTSTPIDSMYRFEERQAQPAGTVQPYAGTT